MVKALGSRFLRLIDWLIDDELTLTWLVYWIRTARSVFTGAGPKWLNITGQYSASRIFVVQLWFITAIRTTLTIEICQRKFCFGASRFRARQTVRGPKKHCFWDGMNFVRWGLRGICRMSNKTVTNSKSLMLRFLLSAQKTLFQIFRSSRLGWTSQKFFFREKTLQDCAWRQMPSWWYTSPSRLSLFKSIARLLVPTHSTLQGFGFLFRFVFPSGSPLHAAHQCNTQGLAFYSAPYYMYRVATYFLDEMVTAMATGMVERHKSVGPVFYTVL